MICNSCNSSLFLKNVAYCRNRVLKIIISSDYYSPQVQESLCFASGPYCSSLYVLYQNACTYNWEILVLHMQQFRKTKKHKPPPTTTLTILISILYGFLDLEAALNLTQPGQNIPFLVLRSTVRVPQCWRTLAGDWRTISGVSRWFLLLLHTRMNGTFCRYDFPKGKCTENIPSVELIQKMKLKWSSRNNEAL